jgi:hypothetical protein
LLAARRAARRASDVGTQSVTQFIGNLSVRAATTFRVPPFDAFG